MCGELQACGTCAVLYMYCKTWRKHSQERMHGNVHASLRQVGGRRVVGVRKARGTVFKHALYPSIKNKLNTTNPKHITTQRAINTKQYMTRHQPRNMQHCSTTRTLTTRRKHHIRNARIQSSDNNRTPSRNEPWQNTINIQTVVQQQARTQSQQPHAPIPKHQIKHYRKESAEANAEQAQVWWLVSPPSASASAARGATTCTCRNSPPKTNTYVAKHTT